VTRRHPVTFTNRRGERLVGIVHPPAAGEGDTAVVLLSPGVKTRVAPHRLYNKLTETLVAQGVWVFRFDFYGLGDSEGEVDEPYLADLYGSVALGRYVDDTNDAIEWMARTYPVQRFVVGGLCGGAITGLLATRGDRRVAGLIGFGLPIMVEGRGIDKVAQMTGGQLARVRQGYLRKLADPRAWARLLTFQTDLRLLKRAFQRPPAPPVASVAVATAGTPAAAAPPPTSNVNPHFAPAFFEAADRGMRMLLVFSETDRLWWEFEEKFLRIHPGVLERYADRVKVSVVPEANHIFTLEAWQEDVKRRLAAWLDAEIGAGTAVAVGRAADARPQAS
jgi:alpha-beta hydrolase superfamily lysophospholipase